MIAIDFETDAIVDHRPPKPVGVAMKIDDEPSKYYTGEDIVPNVQKAFGSDDALLFHNAAFDIAVAVEHCGVEWPAWARIQDTMVLIFLNDPHSRTLGLKSAGEKILDRAPDEQDDLKEWIVANIKEADRRNFGKYIADAARDPQGAKLVAKYAKQDTDLTKALYDHQIIELSQNPGMVSAYQTEMRLLPHLTKATQKGIRVDREGLQASLDQLINAHKRITKQILWRIREPTYPFPCVINLDSGDQLARQLLRVKMATEEGWPLTEKKKQLKTDKNTLLERVTDPDVAHWLEYRSSLNTIIGFFDQWLAFSAIDGRIHPQWNQVRTAHGSKMAGTRTGRLSSEKPNITNVPTELDTPVPEGYPPLPNIRSFCLPEEGQKWVSRDFCAQEMRLLAHFEHEVATAVNQVRTFDLEVGTAKARSFGATGPQPLYDAFVAVVNTDPHAMVAELINAQRKEGKLTRKQVKGIAFGLLYGMGLKATANTLGISVDAAGKLVDAYLNALPGVESIRRYARGCTPMNKRYLTTFGGRRYQAEIGDDGRDYSYKLVNYLIQGSAADMTKQCLIRLFEGMPEDWTFMCAVHDQIDVSMPVGEDELAYDNHLKRSMEDSLPGMDVPMLTDVSTGLTWGECK